MRLTAPVYQLRRKARLLSHDARIPLHEALDRIAAQEGFAGWSLLAGAAEETRAASKLQPEKPSCAAIRSSASCRGMRAWRDRSRALCLN